jgi:hypothetical protein
VSIVPKFLIEVPHEADAIACARVIHVFLASGSHFLTNAEWGCRDGVHSAWLIVDLETRDEARAIVPPAFRADARVIGLTRFSLEEIDAILERHGGARRAP